jgi:hypothetical protein
MPAISIDTFFACSLLVSVALVATGFTVASMQTQIDSMQNLNMHDYLRTFADHIVSSSGMPSNWGSANIMPTAFGLAKANSAMLFCLDGDKVSRLNSQNSFAISYLDALAATRLNKVAMGISVSQMLQIQISSLSDRIVDNSTEYTFQVKVNQEGLPVEVKLHYYVLASSYVSESETATNPQGDCTLVVDVPNSANGPSMLAVFARSNFDQRITACQGIVFSHNMQNPRNNESILSLTPLNNSLIVGSNASDAMIGSIHAFSYSYQSQLAQTDSQTYVLPAFVEHSPILVIAQGTDSSGDFMEWTAYPQVPLAFGNDFSRGDVNVFTYPVTIEGVLYKLTLRFGDVTH